MINEERDPLESILLLASESVGRTLRRREVTWQEWRQKLLRAWANDSRALMTALLEDGPDEQAQK